MFKWLIVLVVVAGLGAGAWWWFSRDDVAPVTFRTAKVASGDLVASIAATGTIQPEETVDVGAQVAGRILRFGNDAAGNPIDFRSNVEENMLLAEIDDSVYQTEVSSAKAQLAQANARVERADADVQAARAKLYQAERDWLRAQKLGPSEALAENSYDAYKSAYEGAVAQVRVSEAAVTEAKASVLLADAAKERADRNLAYCTIKSPVNGVVIARRVNIGQTVVASLNAPSLFLIAKDLKRIRVLVPVNEADIGQIKPDVPVNFTVDAFPGRTFHGKVRKVRLEVSTTQNVVTYPVEIVTENPDELLLPYQTANVKFVTSQRNNVLSVPNAALRYTPAPELMIPDARAKHASASPAGTPTAAPAGGGGPGGGGPGGVASGGPGGGAGGGRSRGPGTRPARTTGTVWVKADNNLLKPVEVKIGMTDGVNTEITGDTLAKDTEVVVGENPRETDAPAQGTNPFAAPQMPRRGGGGGPR